MRVIGLTGGIASGKSTVATMLGELGAPVVDADQVAREVVAPGQPALAEIAEVFGREVLEPGGALDRKKLAALVFGDADKRRALNAITHPRIATATQTLLAELAAKGVPVAVYEAALLVENKAHLALDGLIVVSLEEKRQLERVRARDGLTAEQARARLQAQAPLAAKIEVADFVIDNGGALDRTRQQVAEVWRRICAGEPKRL